jgi:hypothetical protein
MRIGFPHRILIVSCLAALLALAATATAGPVQDLVLRLVDENGNAITDATVARRLPNGDLVKAQRLEDGRYLISNVSVKVLVEVDRPGAGTTVHGLSVPNGIRLVEQTLSFRALRETEEPAAGIPNDNCAEATLVAIPSTTFGFTSGAGLDAGVPECDFGHTAPGVWYAVIGTGTTITATMCDEASFDTRLTVYCGSCEELVCVGADDDFCGIAEESQVAWCSQAGTEYLIFVHGFGSATGIFNLSVSADAVECFPTVACGPIGACCLPDGSCEQGSEAQCEFLGGVYQGDDTKCAVSEYEAFGCDFGLEDISGTGAPVPGATDTDDGGSTVPIGFSFSFFGVAHTEVGVSSNGYLSFGGPLGDYTNEAIPSTNTPNNLIAPFWDDWAPDLAGDVDFQTKGAAPNRRFIAQWTGVTHYDAGGTSTFQVILFEGSNCIRFRYDDELTVVSPTVGIEDPDGETGIDVPGGLIEPGDCIGFCPILAECRIAAALDIKPGSCPNPLNTKIRNGHAVLPVAILGTESFDVTDIDVSTIRLEGVAPIRSAIEDVAAPFEGDDCGCTTAGPDGHADLTLKFNYTAIVEAIGDVDAGDIVPLTITGELENGTPFQGEDCVRILHGVSVIAPNGGEIIESDRTFTVQWKTEPVDLIPAQVDIELSVDGGAFYSIPVAMREEDSGSFIWSVPEIASENVVLRVTVWDDQGVGEVDESDQRFEIKAAGATGVPVSRIPSEAYLENGAPDPFSALTTVRFGIPRPTRVELSIYSVEGRVVKRLVSEPMAAGSWERAWDGTDESGNRVTSGAYFLRLVTQETDIVRRVTLLR